MYRDTVDMAEFIFYIFLAVNFTRIKLPPGAWAEDEITNCGSGSSSRFFLHRIEEIL